LALSPTILVFVHNLSCDAPYSSLKISRYSLFFLNSVFRSGNLAE
jgi:hypothetical protein